MRDWIGLANRETQTFPVMDFREALQGVGLVRRIRGRLLLTKAGVTVLDDAPRVWSYLVGRLPYGNDKSMDRPAGWLHLVATAAGRTEQYDAVADAMTGLGWREDGRQPVSGMGVRYAVARTRAVLRNLAASSTGTFGRQQIDSVVQDLCYQAIRGGASGR